MLKKVTAILNAWDLLVEELVHSNKSVRSLF